MALPLNKQNKIAFSTQFNYLHVVANGTQILPDAGHPSGYIDIDLPAGLTRPFFKVFMESDLGGWTPVSGYYSSNADAYITEAGKLRIQIYGNGEDPTPPHTFNWFIYGGNYA